MEFTKDEVELMKSCIKTSIEKVENDAPPPHHAYYDTPGGHLDTAIALIHLDRLLHKINVMLKDYE